MYSANQPISHLKKIVPVSFLLLCLLAVGARAQDNGAADLHKGNAAYNQKNYSEAMQWLKKSADLGNNDAMNLIGTLYDNGQGVNQDYGLAMQWYQKAATLGNSEAMFGVGGLYYDGQGVTQDYGLAMQWFKKSADKGNTDAMDIIAVAYNIGLGVTKDYGQAMYWYQKEAALGNANAMDIVGSSYYSGHGVTKNRDTAITWWKKAAARGNQDAIDALRDVNPPQLKKRINLKIAQKRSAARCLQLLRGLSVALDSGVSYKDFSSRCVDTSIKIREALRSFPKCDLKSEIVLSLDSFNHLHEGGWGDNRLIDSANQHLKDAEMLLR